MVTALAFNAEQGHGTYVVVAKKPTADGSLDPAGAVIGPFGAAEATYRSSKPDQ
jgi:hypothetical protein